MINDLILRVTYNGAVTDLDVDGDVPLRLDISQVINQEIGQVYGIASQNFNLPGTEKNNKFFNHAYNQAAIDIPGFYNTIDCSVIRNGETLLQGQLQLNQVITSEDGFITYEVLITDSAVEFNAALGDKLLKDADFSAYDHTLTSGSIVDSWTNDISGAIFYPLADYGTDEFSLFPTTPLISLTGDTSISGSIDSPETPMGVYQFLPAIKLNKVVDAICNQAGFVYTSSFLDSSDFDNIYMLPKAKEDLGIVGDVQENVLHVTMSANFSRTYLASQVPGTYTNTLAFDEEISDPGNNYNDSTYRYTAPYTGKYFVDMAISMSYDTTAQNGGILALNLQNGTTNTTVTSASVEMENINLFPDQEYFTFNIQTAVNLIQGNTYYAQLYVDWQDQDDGPPYDDWTLEIDKNNSFFKVPRALSIYDDAPVNMALQFDSEYKSIDVFKGILEHFNLVAYIEPDQNKVIKIEQVDEWLRAGEEKDWTEKYNTAARISINHTVNEQPKTLLFQQAEDSDRLSKQSQEQEPNFQYGTLRTISDSNVTTGETEIGKYFAPVVLASAVQYGATNFNGDPTIRIGDSNLVLPHLYKFDNNERESFKFKPRLGYKVTNEIPSTALYSTIHIGNSGSAQAVTGSYGTISNVNALPVVINESKDLHFNNTYPSFVPDSFNIRSGSNNYTNYWKTYIDSLYWDEGKKVTLDLFFEEYEYQDIKLNDKINIGDNAYRINKINGFNLTRRDVVSVELIKDFPSYSPVIVPGTEACPTVSTYTAQQITSSSLLLTGSVDSTGSAVVERGFVFSDTDTTPEIGEAGVTKYPTGSGLGHFDYPVTGLTPNNEYYYRAYASSSGCLEYGLILSSSTLTSSACPEVSTYAIQDITTSSFTMSGSVDDENGATIVERGFVYSSTNTTPVIGGTGVLKQTSSLTPSPGHFSGSVTGWNDDTNIYVRAYASSSGCEEYGDVVSGRTDTAYYAVTLEYGSVDCATVCANFGSNPSGTFYVDVGSGGSGVFAISSKIYTDAAGTTPAPANFYTDGTDCRPADGVGNLGATTGCS